MSSCNLSLQISLNILRNQRHIAQPNEGFLRFGKLQNTQMLTLIHLITSLRSDNWKCLRVPKCSPRQSDYDRSSGVRGSWRTGRSRTGGWWSSTRRWREGASVLATVSPEQTVPPTPAPPGTVQSTMLDHLVTSKKNCPCDPLSLSLCYNLQSDINN